MLEKIKANFPKSISFPHELYLLCKWDEKHGYPISGFFELRAGSPDTFFYWFGNHNADEQLAQFGAGADGSLFCIWKNQNGDEPIVHLGSEGDSLLVLSKNMYDFLCLLAIGYDDLGYDDLTNPPDDIESINIDFQKWVAEITDSKIPENGFSIVNEARTLFPDFENWVNSTSNI